MRDTADARLFVCALAGVITILSLASPAALASQNEDLFRGTVTPAGEIKDPSGKIVGKVVMNRGSTFDYAKMNIREDGAVINSDGKIIGHLVMNFESSGAPAKTAAFPGSRSAPLGNSTRSAFTAGPILPSSLLANTRVGGPPESAGGFFPDISMGGSISGSARGGLGPLANNTALGGYEPQRDIYESSSGGPLSQNAGPPNLLRGGISTTAPQPEPNHLGDVLGGLNTPGRFPDVGFQATDTLRGGAGGAQTVQAANVLGGLNTPGRFPDVGLQATGELKGASGGVQTAQAANVLGGLNTPGRFPDVTLQATDNLIAKAGGTQAPPPGNVLGGLNTPGRFPDTGLQITDELKSGAGGIQTAAAANVAGGLNTPGRFPDVGLQSTDELARGGGGIKTEAAATVAGGLNTPGRFPDVGLQSTDQLKGGGGGGVQTLAAANTLGGLNTPGRFPDISLQATDDLKANARNSQRADAMTRSAFTPVTNATISGGGSNGAQQRNPDFAVQVESNQAASNPANSGGTGTSSGALTGVRSQQSSTNGTNVGEFKGVRNREQDLSDLKQRTTSRLDAVIADGNVTKKQEVILRKEIKDASALERKFMTDGKLKSKELNTLFSQWDSIMNDLSRFVGRNARRNR